MKLYSFCDYTDNFDLLFKTFAEEIKAQIHNEEYDFVILTTRRCFALIVAVQKKHNVFNQNEWSKIISSQSIDIINFNDKKLLLVDDIMIHGTAVYNIYTKLQNSSAQTVDTFVMAKSIEYPDFYLIKTNKDYEQMLLLSQKDWQKLSNEVLYYFYNFSIPYISYVFGFTNVETVNKCFQFKFSKFNNDIKNAIYEISKNRKNAEIIHYGVCNSKLIKYTCIRQYEFEQTIYIPYCELKDFTSESLIESWKNISNKYKMNNIFSKISASTDIYKVYSLLLTFIQLKKFELYTDWIDKSFYEGFYSDLIILLDKIKNDNIVTAYDLENFLINIGLKKCEFKPKQKSSIYISALSKKEYNSDDKLMDFFMYIFQISKNEGNAFKNMLNKYFENSKLNDTNILHRSMFPTSYIMPYFKKDNKYHLLSFVIFLLDSGIISHIVDLMENKSGEKIVATNLKTGEQSYRILYSIDPKAFLITAKYCDVYICKNGKYDPSDEEIRLFIEYIKESDNNDIIKNIQFDYLLELLTSLRNGNINDLFAVYNTLKDKKILLKLLPIFNNIVHYFYK